MHPVSLDTRFGWYERYMKRSRYVILAPLILIALAFGASRWAHTLQRSVAEYTSPLVGSPVYPGEQLPPLTQRVVIIVVSGISYEAAMQADMPIFHTLRRAGASAPMVSRPPAYWQSARTTLMTGVWPDLNNAAVLEADPATPRPITLDHIAAAARDTGLRTAVSGSATWERLLPADTVDATFYAADGGVVADGNIVQAALEFIADPQYNLILVHLTQLEETGRAAGIESVAYAGAARQIDSHLRQITRQMDLAQSVLMVTSDVVLLEDGASAGGEAKPQDLPFVMAGQNVIAGTFSPVRQVDLAPTVAVFLGTRLPAAAQGAPLYDLLHLDQEMVTLSHIQLAAQKTALGEAYVTAIGYEGVGDVIHQDLAAAHQSFLEGNQAGALETARLVTGELAAEMAQAKATRIKSEQVQRLAISMLGWLLPLLFFWSRRPPRALLCILAALLTASVFYGLYWLEGHHFSLSDITGEAGILAPSVARDAIAGLAVGGLFVMAGLLHGDRHRLLPTVAIVYDYGLLAVYLSAMPVLVAYWHHGAAIRWYLPDLRLIALHGIALRQVTIVASLSVLLPWLIGLVLWVMGKWHQRAEARTQEWDSIAYLRRR